MKMNNHYFILIKHRPIVFLHGDYETRSYLNIGYVLVSTEWDRRSGVRGQAPARGLSLQAFVFHSISVFK